jgi:hypothetical protein
MVIITIIVNVTIKNLILLNLALTFINEVGCN